MIYEDYIIHAKVSWPRVHPWSLAGEITENKTTKKDRKAITNNSDS